MNRIFTLLVLLSLFSCKKVDAVLLRFFGEEKIMEEQIDYSSIDFYPLFDGCKAISFEESKVCFETILHAKLEERIQGLQLTTEESVTDTISVKLTVNKKGELGCNEVLMNEDLNYFFPYLSSDVIALIKDLPKVIPAQKRGIPVFSSYTIPLVIETQEEGLQLNFE